jgi:hypothetical protein
MIPEQGIIIEINENNNSAILDNVVLKKHSKINQVQNIELLVMKVLDVVFFDFSIMKSVKVTTSDKVTFTILRRCYFAADNSASSSTNTPTY